MSIRKVIAKNLAILGSVFGLVGCGAPALTTMKPHVAKPTSQIWLVGQVPGWQATDVVRQAETASIVADALAVAPSQLMARLANSLQTTPAALNVIVMSGPLPNPLLDLVRSHPEVKFEVVGATGAVPNLANLRVVQFDSLVQAYLLGWSVGQLAILQSNQQIGWSQDAYTTMTKAQIQAVLAGLYTADPNALVLPFSVALAQQGATLSTTSPKIIFSPGDLLSSTVTSLQKNGITLVSFTPLTPAAAVQPQAVPDESVLPIELQAFSTKRWQPGVSTINVASMLSIQGGQIATTIQGLLSGFALGLTDSTVAAAWPQVPPSVQTAWAPIVATGSSP